MGIKSFELEPTKENLLETLRTDAIGRNQYIDSFVKVCNALDINCSIAIDARWGAGKTFFVKQTKLVLDAHNPNIKDLLVEEKVTVKNTFGSFTDKTSGDTILQPQVCVYYDAWANDNDADPLISLVYEIIRNTASEYSFEKKLDLKEILKMAGHIASLFSGFNSDSFEKLLTSEDPLAEIKAQKDIHKQITIFFESLLTEKGNRLVIFIDELDRCRPGFAVKLLERIKHYFSNKKITFVFSVNIEELQHTIKKYYGNDFDACRYLDRFFDFRIELPPANMEKYYRTIGVTDVVHYYELVCRAVIKKYRFEMREIGKYYRIVDFTVGNAIDRNGMRTFTGEDTAFQFGLSYVVPIMLGLRMYDIKLYDEFINGKNSAPMIDILTDKDIDFNAFRNLLFQGEAYTKDNGQATVVRLEDKLQSAYEAVFVKPDSIYNNETHIGSCRFTRYTRTRLLSVASMLSGLTKFDS